MLLVRVLSVDPLDVHLGNVSFVFVAKLVHPANQLVPLGGQLCELVIKGHFLLPVFDLQSPQMFKLRLQVPDAPARGFVVVLEAFQVV